MDLYTPPSVAYGGAYSIRPYDRVRVILQNTDAILQPGTCEDSKNESVFATVGGVWWDVFNTPLRPNTCDSSKHRCDPPTGHVWGFKKRIRIRHRRWHLVGRMRYAPTTGYVRSFEIPIRSLDRKGGDFWEVGRWGLPLAGEVGVNEFGEEEDDDQDYNNEGA